MEGAIFPSNILLLQVLLERHESYKSDVELDRGRLLSDMERLEKCKLEAEAENLRLSGENNDLTDQLDCLNQAIAESDTQIQTLTSTLERTQLEVQGLASCASRAALLEEELVRMEKEQAHLREEFTITQEGEKNAIQRWKKAECGLDNLHDQLDRMEMASREERERNFELFKRMERKQMVVKDGSFVGGLRADGQNRNKIGMASHFVGDILQENAKLQRFVVELKELLQNSDEEAQNLREQMTLHRSLDQSLSEKGEYSGSHHLPLSEELRFREPITKEVHVHHHYHGSTSTSLRSKPRTGRLRIPVPHRQHRNSSAPPFMLEWQKKKPGARRAIKYMKPPASSITRAMNAPGLSSSPSSPRSGYRTSSIFDPFEEIESSQPSSPEIPNLTLSNPESLHCGPLSETPANAISKIPEQKQPSLGFPYPRLLESEGDSDAVSVQENKSRKITGQTRHTHSDPILIKDTENLCGQSHRQNAVVNNFDGSSYVCSSSSPSGQAKTLESNTSPFSIFGVNTREYNELAFTSTLTRASFNSPHRISSAGVIFSTTAPMISKTNVVIPKASIPDDKTSLSLLSSAVSSSTRSRNSEPSTQKTAEGLQKTRGVAIIPKFPVRFRAIGVGKRVNSWVHKRPSAQMTDSAGDAVPDSSATAVMARSPGVNQNGPIFGLRPPNPAPTSVHAQGIDHVLLQETLLE